MKKIFQSIVLFVLFFVCGIQQIRLFSQNNFMGEDTPPEGTPYVEIGVAKDRSITIMLLVWNEGDPVWIQTGVDTYEKVMIPSIENPQYGSYKSTTDKLRVYGNLKVFDTSENGSFVKWVNASFCPKLLKLFALHNNLSEVNIDNCKDLEFINLAGSDLPKINIKDNLKLKTLWLPKNNLKELDLTGHLQLEELNVERNQLSEIKGLEQLKELQEFRCDENMFKELDCSKMSKLIQLYASKNNLKKLDVSHSLKLEVLDVSFNHLQEIAFHSEVLSKLIVHHNALDVKMANMIVENLPSRLGKDPGTLVWNDVKNADNQDFEASYPERNTKDLSFVDKALQKNWVTYDGRQEIASRTMLSENTSVFYFDISRRILRFFSDVDFIELYSSNGQRVKQYMNSPREIDFNLFSNGVYILHIRDKKQQYYFKILL